MVVACFRNKLGLLLHEGTLACQPAYLHCMDSLTLDRGADFRRTTYFALYVGQTHGIGMDTKACGRLQQQEPRGFRL